jgi:type IV pilus assembly protein PilV
MSGRQSGFTLVEAMVSVLILSLGLLGVAALQTKSLSSSFTASQRSQAILAAADIADRMRSNRIAIDLAQLVNYSNVAPADNSCREVHYGHLHVPASCTPIQLAADDLFDWQAQVTAMLAGGVGVVCRDSTPDDGAAGAPACDGVGPAYAVKLFWTEKSDNGAAAAAQRFATQVQP